MERDHSHRREPEWTARIPRWRGWLAVAAVLAVGIGMLPVVGSAIERPWGVDCAERGLGAAAECVGESTVMSTGPDAAAVRAAVGDEVAEPAAVQSAQTSEVRSAQGWGVLWRADHETGDLSDWERDGCGGQFNNGAAYTEFSTGTRHGTGGMRLRVPNTNTGESEGARAFRWCETQQHDSLYYSAWYYVPGTVRVNGWWWLMEWKSEGSYNAKFGLGVANRRNGQMYLFLARGADSGGGTWEQDVEDLPAHQWVHVEALYEKAADRTGRVTVWQDGREIIDVAGVRTANSADLGWAAINYGQYTAPRDLTIYVDDAAISTARVGPNGGVPVACSPRPPILVSAAPGEPGRLEVQVVAPTPAGLETNRLRQLRFEGSTNALVDVRSLTGAAGSFTVDLPDRPNQVTFTVRRAEAAPGTTVRLVAVDDCGAWPTLVGGGYGAF